MNLFYDSRAGTGKTTALFNYIKELPPESRVLFLAFNKAIALEAQSRVQQFGLTNTEAYTFNSYGFALCRSQLLSLRNCDMKKLSNLLFFQLCKQDRTLSYVLKPAIDLVHVIRNETTRDLPGGSVSIQFLKHLEEKYGLDSGSHPNYYDYVIKLKNLSDEVTNGGKRDNGGRFGPLLDLTDQVYLPVLRGWKPATKWTHILVDEVQDLNPIQHDFVDLIRGQDTVIVGAGDPFQSIYAFRGAIPDSVPQFKARFNCETRSLNTSWRCSKAVINLAQTIVTDIFASENANEGKVEQLSVPPNDITDRDFILCRVRAPLIALAAYYIKQGIPFTLRCGQDAIDKFDLLHKEVVREMAGSDCKAYRTALQNLVLRKATAFKQSRKFSLHNWILDAGEILDELAKAFMVDDATEVMRQLRLVFEWRSEGGIVLSTIHQAKGLESDRVYLLRPDCIPHPRAESSVDLQQENNLHYVAITRAKTSFHYVADTGLTREEPLLRELDDADMVL